MPLRPRQRSVSPVRPLFFGKVCYWASQSFSRAASNRSTISSACFARFAVLLPVRLSVGAGPLQLCHALSLLEESDAHRTACDPACRARANILAQYSTPLGTDDCRFGCQLFIRCYLIARSHFLLAGKSECCWCLGGACFLVTSFTISCRPSLATAGTRCSSDFPARRSLVSLGCFWKGLNVDQLRSTTAPPPTVNPAHDDPEKGPGRDSAPMGSRGGFQLRLRHSRRRSSPSSTCRAGLSPTSHVRLQISSAHERLFPLASPAIMLLLFRWCCLVFSPHCTVCRPQRVNRRLALLATFFRLLKLRF